MILITSLLTILIIEFVFILLMIRKYEYNKKYYEEQRLKCFEILIKEIENSVNDIHNQHKDSHFLNKESISLYKKQLLQESLARIISNLSKNKDYNMAEIEYVEIESRTSLYIDTLNINLYKEIKDNSIDITKEILYIYD